MDNVSAVGAHNNAVREKDWQYFADRGSRIVAIKVYREKTGCKLPEAIRSVTEYIDNPSARK